MPEPRRTLQWIPSSESILGGRARRRAGVFTDELDKIESCEQSLLLLRHGVTREGRHVEAGAGQLRFCMDGDRWFLRKYRRKLIGGGFVELRCKRSRQRRGSGILVLGLRSLVPVEGGTIFAPELIELLFGCLELIVQQAVFSTEIFDALAHRRHICGKTRERFGGGRGVRRCTGTSCDDAVLHDERIQTMVEVAQHLVIAVDVEINDVLVDAILFLDEGIGLGERVVIAKLAVGLEAVSEPVPAFAMMRVDAGDQIIQRSARLAAGADRFPRYHDQNNYQRHGDLGQHNTEGYHCVSPSAPGRLTAGVRRSCVCTSSAPVLPFVCMSPSCAPTSNTSRPPPAGAVCTVASAGWT